jgi:hypothetical protein
VRALVGISIVSGPFWLIDHGKGGLQLARIACAGLWFRIGGRRRKAGNGTNRNLGAR